MADTFRVTYATLSADNEQLHTAYEEGLTTARGWFGSVPARAGRSEQRTGTARVEVLSPNDTSLVLCTCTRPPAQDVDAAVAAAAREAARLGAPRPWRERVEMLRRAADLIETRGFELSALLSVEVGKNRLEAMGDVEETADLIRYYCDQVEANQGFARPMGQFTPQEKTFSVLRPYGVFGIIAPSISRLPWPRRAGVGRARRRQHRGAEAEPEAPLAGLRFYSSLPRGGRARRRAALVFGRGATGKALVANHPGLDGLLFTGSKEVGMRLLAHFSRDYPKPCIVEMGGKNPAIVMPSADLDAASDGVMRSAFGLQGQKCTACSRVYVHREVESEFTKRLVEKTAKLTVGDPARSASISRPGDPRRAVGHRARAADARRDGKVLAGGEVLRDGDRRTAISSRRRSSPACPRNIASSATSCSCRSWRLRPSTRWAKRSTLRTAPSTA